MSLLFLVDILQISSVACLPKSDMIFAPKKVYCAMIFVVLAIKT